MYMYTISIHTFSWKKAFLLFISVGLLVAGLSAYVQSSWMPLRALTLGPAAPADTKDGLGSSFVAPGKPVRLVIPAIGVDAHIESVGLSWRRNGDMGTPSNFTNVAWYNQGPLPGMPGSAVIDGHLDGKDVPQAVFYNLGSLKPGDLVKVIDNANKTLTFRVVESRLYDYDAPTADIFYGDASKARLNLITCAGDWIQSERVYQQRIVVFTEMVP